MSQWLQCDFYDNCHSDGILWIETPKVSTSLDLFQE